MFYELVVTHENEYMNIPYKHRAPIDTIFSSPPPYLLRAHCPHQPCILALPETRARARGGLKGLQLRGVVTFAISLFLFSPASGRRKRLFPVRVQSALIFCDFRWGGYYSQGAM